MEYFTDSTEHGRHSQAIGDKWDGMMYSIGLLDTYIIYIDVLCYCVYEHIYIYITRRFPHVYAGFGNGRQ